MEPLVLFTRFALILSVFHATFAAFGDDISQDNEDNRFAEMGQVVKNTFDVIDGNITLVLDVQDTKDIKELWILDFEPYRFNEDALPIDELTGELLEENTGECSSVYQSDEWIFFDDEYFKDRTANQLSAKNLFTKFEFGGTYDANDIRTDKIHYTGPLSNFFDCKKSDGFTDVWEKTSIASDDEIEYKTRLYTTNVRPKDQDDMTAGISFVQSHIVLIWRLSRQAIGNFIISSTAILRPLIDFARVSAVWDTAGDPIPELARLHLRFTTILDSNDHQLAYSSTGFTFTPDNPLHGLNDTITEPLGTLASAPDCVLILDYGTGQHEQCHQTWDFILILDIDTTNQLQNDIPVDASATMDFFFDVYNCEEDPCTLIDSDAQVSTLITIQTVVFIRDEEEDQFTLILVSLEGANNHTLDGTLPAARAVAHKEDVTLKVKFSPAVLRDQFELILKLFMVCKGDVVGAQGCLDAPLTERYVARLADDFSYSGVDVNGTEFSYSDDNLTGDYHQALSSYQYITDQGGDPYHESKFTNVALSAESSVYTITTIYKLDETNRRKRSLTGQQVDDMVRTKYFTSSTRFTSTGRQRRDIETSARQFHGLNVGMTSQGCPAGARHLPEVLDCECPANTTYDLTEFQCLNAPDQYEEPKLEDDDDSDVIIVELEEKSGSDNTVPSMIGILILNVIFQQMF